MSALHELFGVVRAACSPRSWSRGIELVRAEAVEGVREQDSDIELHVKQPGRTVPLEVHLYPEDEEWECSCDSTADACEHVAAAILGLRQARKAGQALPTSTKAGGRLRYLLSADGMRVVVKRLVTSGDQLVPLGESLAALLSGREQGPAVAPSKVDLTIDRLLTMKRLRSLPLETFASLVPLLADAKDVWIDDRRAIVNRTPITPETTIVDAKAGGFHLKLRRDPRILELFVPGVALCQPPPESASEQPPIQLELRLLGAVERSGRQLEKLPSEQHIGPAQVAHFVTEELPVLRKQLNVRVKTRRLPGPSRKLKPRVLLEVEQLGATLTLLPIMVYGDPPCARLENGGLVHLRGPIPMRDVRLERHEAVKFNEQLGLPLAHRADFVGKDAAEMAAKLRRYKGDVVGDVHLRLYPTKALEARIVDADGFAVQFVASSNDGEELSADAAEVVAAWRRGESLVPLTGGGWAALPDNWLARYGNRVEELLAARTASGSVARHAQPVLAELCAVLQHPPPLAVQGLRPLLEGFESLPAAPLPDDLQATLRDYQRAGVNWLSFLRDASLGALLADDMGLGKTLQSLCALRGRSLVVCPTSVVHNWADEIRRFRPGLAHSVYHGSGRQLDREVDVTLTTYALLRRDIEILKAEAWDVVVLDEAQAIKNPDSQVARAAYQLQAGFRVALSGTPVENRLEELWSQMHFVNRGLLGGRGDFAQRYEREILEGVDGAAERLRARIKPFLLRRMKREVEAQLPPRSDALMHCELDSAERDIYDAIRLTTHKQVVERFADGGNVMQALEALLRLRQAACDRALVPGAAAGDGPSSKIKRLLGALEQAVSGGHKSLVFSQWTGLLDRVQPWLDKRGIGYTRLDGSTRDRGAVVNEFQSDDGPPVMLISLKAGGTGLNLTAADHVFLLDPWWNPAAEDQAADRAHRIGQTRPVMVYRLVAKDTVEERIIALQLQKRRLAAAALGGGDQALRLTRDDLLDLLR